MREARIFKALGDPVRLRIVSRLSGGSAHTLGDLTTGLGVSRQAARKQVEVLADVKIVRLKPDGRTVKVTLNPDSLKSGRDFIAKLERQWDRRLEKLKDFMERNRD